MERTEICKMREKKILILPGGLHIGGAEKVARDIALYAKPGQYEFHYLVFGTRVGGYEAQLERQGCRVIHCPEPRGHYGRYLRFLLRFFLREQYYAIHAHTMFSCGWAMLAGRLVGVPIRIAHAHSALREEGNWVRRGYEKRMRRLILSCATDLAACSESAGQRLFGLDPWKDRGILLPNGIDNGAFAYEDAQRRAIRERLALEDAFLLGHVGRLDRVKNQIFLLELLPKLLEKQENCRLLLVGDGEDRPMLEARAKVLHLENYVIFAGNTDDPAPFYSAMDVFCFPSLYEGMPLALLEARANGLPCVVSRQVEETGLDLDAPDAWVDAILKARRGGANPGPDIRESMERVYGLYEQNQNPLSH